MVPGVRAEAGLRACSIEVVGAGHLRDGAQRCEPGILGPLPLLSGLMDVGPGPTHRANRVAAADQGAAIHLAVAPG